MNIPAKITKGDSVSWKDDPGMDNLRNPVTAVLGWTLKYAIRGASSLTLTATADGQGWQTTMTAANSAGLSPGDYKWQAYAEKASERVTLGNGLLKIMQDMVSQQAGAENRSQIKQDLDAVQAAMRAIISGGAIQKYVIANRQVEKMSMADLIMLESKLKVEYAREQKSQQMANGQGNPNNVLVRF